MHRFWEIIIEPLLDITASRTVIEVGSQHGMHTEIIARYCEQKGGVLHAIDPAPQFDTEEYSGKFKKHFRFYKDLSLNALYKIRECDAVLIDGDHNWYTVYNELLSIEKTAKKQGKFPIVFLHDIDWPYGRRDLYYDPGTIPEVYRHPYEKKGIMPGRPSLVDKGGLNPSLNNSIYENDNKNGVLTAVEDFLAQTSLPLSFAHVPGLHGLGVIFESDVEAVDEFLKDFQPDAKRKSYIQLIESERVEKLIQYSDKSKKVEALTEDLARKTDVFTASEDRHKKSIEEKDREIAEIQARFAEHTAAFKTKEAEYAGTIAKQEREIAETQKRLADNTEVFSAKEAEYKGTIQEKEREIAKTNRRMEENEKHVKAIEGQLVEKDRMHKTREEEYANRVEEMTRQIAEISAHAAQRDRDLTAHREEYRRGIEKKEREIAALNRDVEKKKREIGYILNSVRYRIGVSLVEGTRSLRATVLLPFRLAALFYEGMRKTNKRAGVPDRKNKPDKTVIRAPLIRRHGGPSVGINKWKDVSRISSKAFRMLRNGQVMALLKKIRRHARWRQEASIIRQSGSFDGEYYLQTYADVKSAGIDPVWHYVTNGWKEGRDPNAAFSTDDYLAINSEIEGSDGNPFVHWIQSRRRESRKSRSVSVPDAAPPREGILYIIHDGGGGLVYTSFDLLRSVSGLGPSRLLRTGKKEWRIYEYTGDVPRCMYRYTFNEDWSAVRDINGERRKALEDICSRFNPALVHVRVLLGTGPSVIDFFKDKGLPVVFSFHDFSAICPNIHLISNGNFCSGDCQSHQNTKDCSYLRSWFGNITPLRASYRATWSKRVESSLVRCDAYVVTSDFTKTIILMNYPTLSPEKFFNIEHGRDFSERRALGTVYEKGRPCDIVFFGALNEVKGCSLVLDIIKINEERGGPLRFHIIGNVSEKYREEYSLFENVVLYGKYERDDLFKIVKQIKPSLAILPSICPETYSHTLTESWAYGIPVLGTSYGAIGERIEKHNGGWTLEPVNAQEWYDRIFNILDDRAGYLKTIKNIPDIGIKSVDQMAEEYCAVYKGLLRQEKERPSGQPVTPGAAAPLNPVRAPGKKAGNQAIELIDVKDLSGFTYKDPDGIAIIMPSINTKKGMDTAETLLISAGMGCKLLVVHDTLRQGFIKTLNDTAARITARYIVYLAEDAFPGVDWLRSAYETLEKSGKGLLAFNDGKWKGRIAAFGMVRTEWVKTLYGGPVFYPGYHSHAADNELTVIARIREMHEYNPDCTLVEYDPYKRRHSVLSNQQDKKLFHSRFLGGFDGLVSLERLQELAAEYRVEWPPEGKRPNTSAWPAGGKTDRAKAKKVHTQVKGIRECLLAEGFSGRAYSDLSRLAEQNEDPYLKRLATWELVLWHADRYTAQDARKCLGLLRAVTLDEGDLDSLRRAAVIEAECHDTLGDAERGKHVIERALALGPTADLYFAAANLEASPSGRVDWINKAFDLHGITGVDFSPSPGLPPFDCLRPGDAPREGRRSTGDSPSVTVIIPAYNAEKTIRTALDSTLAQTWANLEVLVVDDCSTDGTARIVKVYEEKDRRVTLISAKENRGPYVSRNIALKQAGGDFVTCHDADDWFHPEKIERQVTHLIGAPDVISNMTHLARAKHDLKLWRRGNPGSYMQLNMSSLMFRRKPVMKTIGYWDSVRFGGDSEFVQRLRRAFGNNSEVHVPAGPLSFSRQSENSLTGDTAYGYRGYFMGARKEYRESSRHYHDQADSLFFGYPQKTRPFPIPEPMRPGQKNGRSKRRHFDVVIASDFRLPGGTTSSNIEEIRAQKGLGLRTGLVQVSRYSPSAYDRINDKVRKMIDGNSVQMIVYGEEVTCDLLIVRHPPVLQDYQDYIPKVSPRKTLVAINQSPLRDYGVTSERMYDFETCAGNLVRYFGQRGVWYPIGPLVRDAVIKEERTEEVITLADTDWVNIINVNEWNSRSARCRRKFPVIGRHSRDQYTKWPDNAQEILDAYPNDDGFRVKILGGASSAEKVLGFIPERWEVYPFDSMQPREFLSEIDVFVYFHHKDWVEAFGRVPLEAMAAGVPVILPEHFHPLFKEAAMYARPSQVQDIVMKLYRDPTLYQERAEAGRSFVETNFGYSQHKRRLEPLVKALQKTN